MISLDFSCPISHSIDWLIDNNCCVRLSHDFIDLMALGTN